MIATVPVIVAVPMEAAPSIEPPPVTDAIKAGARAVEPTEVPDAPTPGIEMGPRSTPIADPGQAICLAAERHRPDRGCLRRFYETKTAEQQGNQPQ